MFLNFGEICSPKAIMGSTILDKGHVLWDPLPTTCMDGISFKKGLSADPSCVAHFRLLYARLMLDKMGAPLDVSNISSG